MSGVFLTGFGTTSDRKSTSKQESEAPDGTWSALSRAPGDNWWRRLRGVVEERQLFAWADEGMDRLILQEFKGSEPTVPVLRYPRKLNTVASFDAREPEN